MANRALYANRRNKRKMFKANKAIKAHRAEIIKNSCKHVEE